MKHAPSTVIVDTHVLTDGTLDLYGYTGFGSATRSNCEEVAHRALIAAQSHLATNLREALGTEGLHIAHQPIAQYQSSIIRTLWHHGEKYMSYCIGPVTDIIKLCDLTDNEREALVVQSSRLGGEGKMAFGLASGLSATLISRASGYGSTLTFVGTVVFEPRIFPRTIGIIERLQERGTRFVYASRDNDSVVSAVAHAAHIKADTVYPAPLSMHTPEMQLVSNVPSKDFAAYIDRYQSGSYVVRHDMSELA